MLSAIYAFPPHPQALLGLRPAPKAFKCEPDNQLIIRVETVELEGGHECSRPSEFARPLYEVAPDWIQQRLGLCLDLTTEVAMLSCLAQSS